MSAHFAYKHMPAGGVGILDEQYRPYVSGGIGAAVQVYATKVIDVESIDSRPLLFPPDVFIGDYPVGIPHIGPIVVVTDPVLLASIALSMPHVSSLVLPFTPVVGTGELLDVVSMMLGVRQWLDVGLGVAMNVAEILGVATQPSFILSVEGDPAKLIESATLVLFTVGVNMGVSVNMGIGQVFDEPMGIDDSFDQNLTQTLDY